MHRAFLFLEDAMELTNEELLEILRGLTGKKDHLTIFKFTTHWKIMLDTPDLDGKNGRAQVRNLRSYKDLREALIGEIKYELSPMPF
jgi:hypothetical protein